MTSNTRPILFNRYGHEVSTHCGQNNPYGCGAPLDAPDGHCTNVAFHEARFFKTRDDSPKGTTVITSKMIDEVTWAAWHEFRYPRPALDEPTDAFKRAIRTAIETTEALQAKKEQNR